jgi:hypothetical protein
MTLLYELKVATLEANLSAICVGVASSHESQVFVHLSPPHALKLR